MFSQYSWWDFAKFVLVLAVPYYAFVLWKYYREDIREWISNRGQPQSKLVAQDTDDQEDSSPSLFQVTDYSKSSQQNTTQNAALADWLQAPVLSQSDETQQAINPTEYPQEEVELHGPALNDKTDVAFGLPVVVASDNFSEQSIDEIIDAAQRLAKDEQGRVTPIDAEDKPAARIADIINQQQDHPLDRFAFTR